MEFVDLGCRPFFEALKLQEQAVERIASGFEQEKVHFVEHPHTFTVGRGGDAANLLALRDHQGNPIELIRISRGGDVTYHGPGQLVGYPHLDLRRRGRDVHRYLRGLENTLIEAAAHFGVRAFRRPGLTGVWTGQGKLASIGVGVRRWITLHGFALNVATSLEYFRLIHPCGLPDCPVTSLSRLLNRPVELGEAREAVSKALLRTFDSPLEDEPETVGLSQPLTEAQ